MYGTEPWSYYFANLVLNFNGLLLLAVVSLPALAVTYFVDEKRLGLVKAGPERSSPFTLLAMRLLPLYIWVGILTSQPHKEERFMFPAYPLICFNAAVTLYLARGWLEVAYIRATASPYQVSTVSPSIPRTDVHIRTGIQGESFQPVHVIGDRCDISALDISDGGPIQLLSCPAEGRPRL